MRIVTAQIKFVMRDNDPDIAQISDNRLKENLEWLLSQEHVGLAVYQQVIAKHVHVPGDAGEHDPPPDFYA